MAGIGLPQPPKPQRAEKNPQLSLRLDCHNSKSDNAPEPRIATTPESATATRAAPTPDYHTPQTRNAHGGRSRNGRPHPDSTCPPFNKSPQQQRSPTRLPALLHPVLLASYLPSTYHQVANRPSAESHQRRPPSASSSAPRIETSIQQKSLSTFTCDYSRRPSSPAHQQTTVRPRRRPSVISPPAREAILLASHLSNRPHDEGAQLVYLRNHAKLYLPLTYQTRPQASDPDHPRHLSASESGTKRAPIPRQPLKRASCREEPADSSPIPRRAPLRSYTSPEVINRPEPSKSALRIPITDLPRGT